MQAPVTEKRAYLGPSNYLTYTHHTLEFWGVWVTEDTSPILGANRLSHPTLISPRKERTIIRVRGHILEIRVDSCVK